MQRHWKEAPLVPTFLVQLVQAQTVTKFVEDLRRKAQDLDMMARKKEEWKIGLFYLHLLIIFSFALHEC